LNRAPAKNFKAPAKLLCMKVEELARFGLKDEIIGILKDEGIAELFPPQEEALQKGLLDLERSFVISVPTASGKTLISELLMVRSLLDRGGKCLYVVPLRALAREKVEEFKKYEKLGIRAGISTGDFDEADNWLAKYEIIVTTSEKADSLLRHRSEWLAQVNVLVADEIHLIHDGDRGPTLEVTIAKLRHLNPGMLILGLSATIKNAGEIASWLDAELVQQEWRPVDLKEGVYLDGAILFDDSRRVNVEPIVDEPGMNLALETVKNDAQALVFVNTRKRAEKFASDGAIAMKRFLKKAQQRRLKEISNEVLTALPEPTRICKRLAKCVEGATAFHHAGLHARQRKVVEEAFKNNEIKVLSATPTLAAGVNLPARRVVVRDTVRYSGGRGNVGITVLEYKQAAGRAGRPKYDTFGEAVMVARSQDERDRLLEEYVLAEPEEIDSKLAVESALRTHVLATVAMQYANTFSGLMEFFSRTFYAHQQELYTIEEAVGRQVEFLVKEGFLEEKGERIFATLLGVRTSELYLDPLSAVMLRDSLLFAQTRRTNDVSYLHAIARCSEIGSLYLRRSDYDFCMAQLYENEEFLLTAQPNQLQEPWEFEGYLADFKLALFLNDWIGEKGEDFLLERYSLGPGDVRSRISVADWLLYSMVELGKVLRAGKLNEIARLRIRVKHGIRRELLELVSLKGVGRVRARMLYRSGFRKLKDLKKAPVEEIAGVKLIGRATAASIKKQLGEDVEAQEERQAKIVDF